MPLLLLAGTKGPTALVADERLLRLAATPLVKERGGEYAQGLLSAREHPRFHHFIVEVKLAPAKRGESNAFIATANCR